MNIYSRQSAMAAFTVMALTFTSVSDADIAGEMGSWFNSMGGYSNTTPAQVIKGQTGTTYMGGSLFTRFPVKNYSLVNMQAPSITMGCGGIDAYGGSFSFINGNKLTDLFKNIGANATGYAFMLALKMMTPDVESELEKMQKIMQEINGLNINSCHLAEGIVNTAAEAIPGEKAKAAYANATQGQATNDWNSTMNDLGTAMSKIRTIATATPLPPAGQVDPNLSMRPHNIVFDAFNNEDPGGVFSVGLRKMIMSMIGTIIVVPPGGADATPDGSQKTTFVYIRPTGLTLQDFVGDPDSALSTDAAAKILICTDSDIYCLKPDVPASGGAPLAVASLSNMVKTTMDLEISAIQSRSATNFPRDSVAGTLMINSTMPIWRLTNMIAMSGSGGMDEKVFAQGIATELAYGWLDESLRAVGMVVARYAGKTESISGDTDALKTIQDNIKTAEDDLKTQRRDAMQAMLTMIENQKNIQWLHQNLLRSMPTDVAKSYVAFGQH